jgi:hypothetical protein
MRGALQGVPVAALPGEAGGGLLSGLFGGEANAPARSTDGATPLPPASVQPVAADAPPAQTNGTGSLDGWLLNNLFGRR